LEGMELRTRIESLDGKAYGAYRSLVGRHRLTVGRGIQYDLFIDHVQADPFAPPSRMRLRIPMAAAALPAEIFSTDARRMAVEDFLARSLRRAAVRLGSEAGRGAAFFVDAGGQEILRRSAVKVAGGPGGFVEARLSVDLPAAGRRILGRQCARLLTEILPRAAEWGLTWGRVDQGAARRWVAQCEDQEHIRGSLREMGLVAFVGDGSILPRESGVSDRPMPAPPAVAFNSPPSLRVEFKTPNAGPVRGMGIPRGVTLIVGGGYHGKSTLLRALERGVYPHIPGDGREWVVTDGSAVKIRAEDGRSVSGVNISPFIADLPGGMSTSSFGTAAASGSTSQAANIVEAVEAGARVLLLDEDTCATNFMMRDLRMQALMRGRAEPIIPFIDRVRQLYEEMGVSSILVMGGCGDYFEVADTVILMQEYLPYDATAEAKRTAMEVPGRRPGDGGNAGPGVADAFSTTRYVDLDSLRKAAGGGRHDSRPRVRVKGLRTLLLGKSALDLWGLEQIVDPSQTRAIGCALAYLAEVAGRRDRGASMTFEEALDLVEGILAGALNRLRGLSAVEIPDDEEEDAGPCTQGR